MILKKRTMKWGKRGIVCLFIALFFLSLLSFSTAQTSQTGCFTEPSYVRLYGVCRQETSSQALTLCNNDPTCFDQYFYSGQACSNVAICTQTSGWCTDICQQANYVAECTDRSSFRAGSRPAICDLGCCICSATNQANVCQGSTGLWWSITLNNCQQKCNTLTNYFMSNFDTTVNQTDCAKLCGVFTPAYSMIVGTVRESKNNQAVPGATIKALGLTTTTDGQGNYALQIMLSGQVPVSASFPGYETNYSSVTVIPGGQAILSFTLAPASTSSISGKVTDNNNQPLNGALVYVSGQTYSQTITNASGDYQLLSLPYGSYTITASKSGYVSTSQAIGLPIGVLPLTNINLVLIPMQQGFIYGLVKDLTNNTPLVQAQVWVDNSFAVLTDVNGKFNISVSADATGINHSVYVTKSGYGASTTQTLLVKLNEQKPTQDFNLVSTRSACSYPASISVSSLTASHVPGTKAVRLSWTKPCNEVAGFFINRSIGTGALRKESSVIYLAVVDAQQMPLTYVDYGVNWSTAYEYKIWAAYDDEAFRLAPATSATITTGDAICEGKFSGSAFKEFCSGTLRKTCDSQNKMVAANYDAATASPADCSSRGSDYRCWGPDSASKTECRRAVCTSPNPLISTLNRSSCYGSNNFCYYDYWAPNWQCNTCARISSCFDYLSQDACQTNSCLGRSCNWIPTQQGNTGWCVEANYNQTDHCRDCSQSAPVGKNNNCNQAICSALGSCYSKTYQTVGGTYQWCTSCGSQSRCVELTTQAECEGSQRRQFSSIPGLIVPSGDVCSLGSCKWDSNLGCFKDGDIDGADECTMPTKVPTARQLICQQDNQAPVTKVSPENYIGVGGALSWITFTANDNNNLKEVAYCIDTTNTCLPTKTLTYQGTTVTENLANSTELKNAYTPSRLRYYLRFRSMDEFYNLENVQSRGLFVDLQGPQIILNYKLLEKVAGSDLTFNIVTTEKAKCTDKLTLVGATTTPWSGLPATMQDTWNITYAKLVDGLYNYELICRDSVGNADAVNITSIIIDAIKAVMVINPTGATNQNSFPFILQTQSLGTCKLYDGSTFKENLGNDTNVPQRHVSQTYNFPNDGYYQTWRAECYIPNRDDAFIPFTIDHQPPITSVELTSKGLTRTVSSNFITSFNDDVTVVFKCEDQPLNGFGCNTTKWCLTALNNTCTPQSTAKVPTVTSSKKLCYQSIDADNNIETILCGEIEIKPGIGVGYKEPPHGVSATPIFNLTITTGLATDLCKFGFLNTINFTRTIDPRNFFTKVNDFEQTIPDFTNNALISGVGFPNSVTSLTLYITCNLTANGEIGLPEALILAYDPTAPVISLSTDPISPVTSGPTVDLVVDADEEVICKYSQSAAAYNDMQGKFPDYDTPRFKTQNREAVSVSNSGSFSYNLACENKAGLISQVKTISYTVDFNAAGAIVQTAPSGSTANQSVLLEVWTNKEGICTYMYNTSNTFTNTGQLYHTATLTNLAEGIYAIPVTCRFAATGKTASDKISFKVDQTAPLMSKVDDGVYSCSLEKTSALFDANDSLSPVTEFEYQLFKTDLAEILAKGATNSTSVIVTNLNLSLDGEYYFKARPKDAAGNWGGFLASDGLTATLANKTECLDQKPPSLSFAKESTSEGTRVTIVCTDKETSCINVVYSTAATAEECQPSQTYQDIPVLLTATAYVCAEASDVVGNKGSLTMKVFIGDEDGDGVTDASDNCPETPAGEQVDSQGCSNKQKSLDTDHDRLPDWWEIRYEDLGCQLNYQEEDSDFDGVTDDLEDYNGDGVSNYDEYLGRTDPCQVTDADSDGVADTSDNCDQTPANEISAIVMDKSSPNYGCGPSEIFSLGDEIDDDWRLKYFNCLECPEAAADNDYDEDGLTNLEEYRLKRTYGESTDPTKKDTDSDGHEDKTEVEKGWDPTDANSPAVEEPSFVLPVILLVLGLLLVLGGTVYLIVRRYKRPTWPAKPTGFGPARPMAGPVPRPIPRAVIPPRPGSYAELIARRKAEREEARKERVGKIFGVFGKTEPLPHLAKIVTQEDKSVFDRLAEATKHYMSRCDETEKLSAAEKNVFEELAKKVKKPTKEEVKRVLKGKPTDEVHQTFNKLVEMVGRHAGKKEAFERLKKYAEEK